MSQQALTYRQRAERILDVTAELVLRWGYKRVTIDEIAKRAGIGKGTIYLHWRTREALFFAVISRESVAYYDELIEAIRQDSLELRPHRQARHAFLGIMQRPLLRAVFSRDMELLGHLGHEKSVAGVRDQKLNAVSELDALFRGHGLLRTDLDAESQRYAMNAVLTGFFLIEPLMVGLSEPDLTTRADALAATIRAAFEPATPPDPEALALVAPKAIAIFQQLREAHVQRVHGDPRRE